MALASLLVFPLGFWGAAHLHYQENPEDTFWTNHPFRQGLNYLQESRGFRNQISIVFESSATPAVKDQISQWLNHVKAVEFFERPQTILDQIFEKVPPNLKLALSSEIRSSHAFQRWIAKSGEERWILYWNATETHEMARFQAEVREKCRGECFIAGIFSAYSEMGTRISDTLLKSLIVSLFLVGLMILLIAKNQNFLNYGLVLASTFWGVFFMLAVLWLTQIPIYFVTCMFATILIGLSGDNIIQYLWGTRRKGCIRQTETLALGTSMLTLSIIAMSFCFLGAYFVPARRLGLLLGFGLIAMFYGDYYLWRSLQTENIRKNIIKSLRERTKSKAR